MLSIIGANCRQFLWIHLVGLSWTALLLAVLAEDLSRSPVGLESIAHHRWTKLFFWLLFSAQLPQLYTAMSIFYCNPSHTVETLPLSIRQLNMTRLLSGFSFIGWGLSSWILVIVAWLHFDRPFEPFVLLFALLALLASATIGMRHRIVRYIIPVLVALMPIPQTERNLYMLLEWMTTPWASMVLSIATASYAIWVVRQEPPRWTRRICEGWGFK